MRLPIVAVGAFLVCCTAVAVVTPSDPGDSCATDKKPTLDIAMTFDGPDFYRGLQAAVASILLLVEAGAGAEQWITWFLSTGIYLTMSLFSMLWSVVMILAGLRLRSGRSAALVYVGAVMAMLPCCAGYCCCFGLPLGIWAIVTMQDEQVKVAFAEG